MMLGQVPNARRLQVSFIRSILPALGLAQLMMIIWSEMKVIAAAFDTVSGRAILHVLLYGRGHLRSRARATILSACLSVVVS
jgi:hypothetical protein